jgi:hypothetical protein
VSEIIKKKNCISRGKLAAGKKTRTPHFCVSCVFDLVQDDLTPFCQHLGTKIDLNYI